MGKSPDLCMAVSLFAYPPRSFLLYQPLRFESKIGSSLSRVQKANEVLIRVSLGLK